MTQSQRAVGTPKVQEKRDVRRAWSDAQRRGWVLAGLIAAAAVVFLLGINWGLPSRQIDQYLFGREEPWTGERIAFLAGGWDTGAKIGADVDRNPIGLVTEPVRLNGSDAQRAEIIRRYRLYSYQPDEMITFRALAQMQSGFDPKLYQYGGLWIYPVGVMLKFGELVQFVPFPDPGVTPLIFYLDNPSAFGRFYIVARLYAALWGLAGVWAVFWIVQRLTQDLMISGAAALAYAFLPVVVNGAHEAKPHLPGAVLMLLAIMAAVKWVETGRFWWWLIVGALWGAAAGMVLTAWVIFVLPIVMVFQRRESAPKRLGITAGAIALGIAVYVITNPYVVINAIGNRELLRSNLGNSKAMYHLSGGGLVNAVRLIGLGTSPLLALLGIASGVMLVVISRQKANEAIEDVAPPPEKPAPPAPPAKRVPPPPSSFRGPAVLRAPAAAPAPSRVPASSPKPVVPSAPARAIAWMLLAPAALVLLQFFLLAGGKPPEYARFGMLVDIALLILAAWGVAVIAKQEIFKQLLAGLLVASTLPYGMAYCRAFVRDGMADNTRMEAAEELYQSAGRILLYAEPAPYNCPPVNVLRRDIVLMPPGSKQGFANDLLLYPVDVPIQNSATVKRLPLKEAPGSLDQFTTPITWASKTFGAEAVRTKGE